MSSNWWIAPASIPALLFLGSEWIANRFGGARPNGILDAMFRGVPADSDDPSSKRSPASVATQVAAAVITYGIGSALVAASNQQLQAVRGPVQHSSIAALVALVVCVAAFPISECLGLGREATSDSVAHALRFLFLRRVKGEDEARARKEAKESVGLADGISLVLSGVIWLVTYVATPHVNLAPANTFVASDVSPIEVPTIGPALSCANVDGLAGIYEGDFRGIHETITIDTVTKTPYGATFHYICTSSGDVPGPDEQGTVYAENCAVQIPMMGTNGRFVRTSSGELRIESTEPKWTLTRSGAIPRPSLAPSSQ